MTDDQDMNIWSPIALLRPNQARLVPEFLGHALRSTALQEQIDLACTSSTQRNLAMGEIASLRLPLPPLEEQRRIANYLDAETARIDALVAAKRRLVVKLRERVDSVTEEGVLGANLKGIVNASAGPVQCNVPGDWTVRPNWSFIREVITFSTGGTEEMLSVSHLTGVTRRDDVSVNMFLAESNVGQKVVHPGDLVINTLWAWMGALGIAHDYGIVSPAYGVYRFTEQDLDPRYFGFLFRSRAYVAEMTRYSKGVWSSRLRLYPESFLALRTPFPTRRVQTQIADAIEGRVNEVTSAIGALERSQKLLTERRQALITAAVTGQFDVSSAA